MRISDCSSDVCSSDLSGGLKVGPAAMLATVSYIAAAQHSRFRPSPSGHMKRLVHTASSFAIALALFFVSQSPDSTGPFTFAGFLPNASPVGKGVGDRTSVLLRMSFSCRFVLCCFL